MKPLENDLIARGDVVDLDVESLNDAATRKLWPLDDDTFKVPPDTPRPRLVYGISDGLFDPSRASITVRPEGLRQPPVARDDVAQPKPGETSTLVDALANDTDVDSDPATLRSSSCSTTGGSRRPAVRVRSSTTRTPCRTSSRTRTAAGDGPDPGADRRQRPAVRGQRLAHHDGQGLHPHGALNDYVKSPRGRVVSVTAAATVSASPAENLAVSLDDNRSPLTRSGGYVGPAAVMLEVTDPGPGDQKDFGTGLRLDPGAGRAQGAAAALPGDRGHRHRRRPRPAVDIPPMPRLAARGLTRDA